MRSILAVTLLALGVFACDRTPDAPPASTRLETTSVPKASAEPAGPARGGLAIEGEGLRIFDASGSARALPFATPQATVIAAVSATISGAVPEQSANAECGAGPTQFARYPDGLQLAFQDGKFAGWFIDKAGLTTVDGVGVGVTRAALDEARTVEITPNSTLGVEFTAGDIGGFLTADGAGGTVESLHAGLTCFFR